MAGGGGIATGAGTRLDVTLKLSQLQNLCKRDPVGYRDDYDAQTRRLESEMGILALQPNSEPSPRLVELIQFGAAVSSSSYKGEESDRIANLLMNLLVGSSSSLTATSSQPSRNVSHISAMPSAALQLHRNVRKACVSALILMRNKGVVEPLCLMELFFRIMAVVPDKKLREILYHHMINDVSNINKKGKRDEKVNRAIQSFLHRIVSTHGSSSHQQKQHAGEESATDIAAKRAVDMVCELYRRRIWTDDRCVAIVASAVQSDSQTVMARAMRFFLGIEEKMADDEIARRDQDWAENSYIDYHAHSKKTKNRQARTIRQLKNRKKAMRRKETGQDWMDLRQEDAGVEASKKLHPAMELLRDPQGLAEYVLKKLRSAGACKYELKLLMMNFVTRLVGNHQLLLLPLYPFLQKYLGGHQRDVTVVLAYCVQACHSQVPPDEVYGILKTIAHNFISERCSEEQMAVGINAARAICARVPSALSTEDDDMNYDDVGQSTAVSMDMEAFARDLAGYANHRDRSVSIAAKGWMNFIREVHPALLKGKDRGLKGTGLHRAGTKPARYGEMKASAGVEGADLLVEYEAKKAAMRKQKNCQEQSDEEEGAEISSEEEDDDDSAPDLVLLDGEHNDDEGPNEEKVGEDADSSPKEDIPDVSKMSKEERDKIKQEVSSTRVFSAADFGMMRKLLEREQRAKSDPREKARRKRAVARGDEFEDLSSEEDDDLDDDEEIRIAGAVNLGDIMALASKKRASKAEKLEKIIAGRTEFESKQRAGGSTNTEKARKKNFVMSKFSYASRSKGRGKAHSMRKRKDIKSQRGTKESKKRRRK